MFNKSDIICFSTSDWDKPWGSKQQLMMRMSATNRILYVEYQASILHLLSLPFLFKRIRKWRNNLNKVNKNIFVFTPYPCLPFGYYFRIMNKINQALLLRSLRKVCQKINFSNYLVWVYPPCAVDLVGKLNQQLNVFHCVADFSNEKTNRLRNKVISHMEEELANESDIILTLTKDLYKKYKTINPNTHLFPSAVDYAAFSSALKEDYIPADILPVKGPRIGLVGYLDGNILDINLLCYIADKHPEWSLVLIGPKFRYLKELNRLAKKNNVYFLGEKKNDKVPYYIKNLDVCIIPYTITQFTNNVSPLKLYEYLALGKPIISTALSDLKEFEDVICVCSDKDEFVNNISLALKENDQDLTRKRLRLAQDNSWDSRIVMISNLLQSTHN